MGNAQYHQLPASGVTHQWCKKGAGFEQTVMLPNEFDNQQFHQGSLPFQMLFVQQQKWQIYGGVVCILCCNEHHVEMIFPPPIYTEEAVLFYHNLFPLKLPIPANATQKQ